MNQNFLKLQTVTIITIFLDLLYWPFIQRLSMSLKGSNTTCSGIEWNSLPGFLHRLKKSKRSREYLLVGAGAYPGLCVSDLLRLTHTMFIHLFIPTKKPSSRNNIQVLGFQLWAQLGSNQRPPDYESGVRKFAIPIRTPNICRTHY